MVIIITMIVVIIMTVIIAAAFGIAVSKGYSVKHTVDPLPEEHWKTEEEGKHERTKSE